MGTVKPVKALWEIMREQNYGRIVVTTSSTGLYGNFGQTNYGAAKLSLVGFMNSLKLEGQKNNIHVNAISPVAAARMTENILPPADRRPAEARLRDAGRGLHLCSNGGADRRDPHRHAPAPSLWPGSTRPRAFYLGEAGLSVEEVRDNWAKITDAAGQQALRQRRANRPRSSSAEMETGTA